MSSIGNGRPIEATDADQIIYVRPNDNSLINFDPGNVLAMPKPTSTATAVQKKAPATNQGKATLIDEQE
nr:hypothetical protein [Tanacetum cinerariifolium]